jgi:predicted transcriptional regulator of viral defense system
VKKEKSHLTVREYAADLAATGHYSFFSSDARTALGTSLSATLLALARLAKQGMIASPAQGFYVIVPPEYRSLGCLPADQFIPALMKKLGQPYYAGLLSAAQYHGAAHHRPQQFQVMLSKNRRPIHCGKVEVSFTARKRLGEIPLQSFNTPRGTIEVSTPEATAIDLVGYQQHIGGLDSVATVLSELAEKIDPEKLAAVAATAPLPWAQRLGYLLERVGAAAATPPLERYVRQHARQSAPLARTAKFSHSQRDERWKLYINAEIEDES